MIANACWWFPESRGPRKLITWEWAIDFLQPVRPGERTRLADWRLEGAVCPASFDSRALQRRTYYGNPSFGRRGAPAINKNDPNRCWIFNGPGQVTLWRCPIRASPVIQPAVSARGTDPV